jgi:signal transduction histidine kinase
LNTQAILKKLPSVVLIVNDNNKIVFSNTAFGKLVGERSEDHIGRSIDETFSSRPGQWNFLADEVTKPLECLAIKNQQELRKNETKLKYERDPLAAESSGNSDFTPPSVITLKQKFFTYDVFEAGPDSEGKPLKGLVLNDITEEKEFLDRMTQAESSSSLKTLAAGISHEISNPLHAIITFSEAIASEENLDKIKIYADKVIKNSKRLGKVLLDFSGYVQKKENGAPHNVNVNESILSAIKFAMLPYQKNNITLEENLEELPEFIADPEEMQLIFFNIINNSFQALKTNGRVKVSSRNDGNFITIKFEDNGSGMPKDVLRKVFNPFYTTKMQGEGTGLGLNITQRLVEKYGGKIEIDSQEGCGTTVSLLFPNPSTLPRQ